jgi:hypothetical protein
LCSDGNRQRLSSTFRRRTSWSQSCWTSPDIAGHRRAPATIAGYHRGRPPRNKGEQYPADPPAVEEIIAVMRAVADRADGRRLRALIVLLWRAGLRIGEALDLQESDLDRGRGAVLVRRGKGGKRREVGMDRWVVYTGVLNRAYDDISIINDPPRADIWAVAVPARVGIALPSCARTSASVRAYCMRLRADEQAYVAAVSGATSIDNALLKTVDRESGADRAGQRTALALQERTGERLVRELRAASGSERRIGQRLAALIRSRNLFGRLSATQDASGIQRVLGELARRNISRSQLPAGALQPNAVDLVAALTL